MHIVPEWYYLPFYAILRAIPNKLMGVIALFGARSLILAFLPWLDTSKVRSARLPAAVSAVLLGVRDRLRRSWAGSARSRRRRLCDRLAIFTFYYFAHFLIILPMLGLVEKTKPLPNSISESVLKKDCRSVQPAPPPSEREGLGNTIMALTGRLSPPPFSLGALANLSRLLAESARIADPAVYRWSFAGPSAATTRRSSSAA